MRNRTNTKIHKFTLALKGVDQHTPNIDDVIFHAGCNDALLYFKCGDAFLDFERESKNFEEAVNSAINDLENASLVAKLIKIADE